jgi:MFS family permease
MKRSLCRTSQKYIAYQASMNLGFYIFQSYYLFFLKENGLTFTDLNLIFAANFAALAILNFPAGNFADRHGRKMAIGIGSLISGAGMMYYGLSSSLYSFLAAEIILAGASALLSGSVEAWYVDDLKLNRKQAEAERVFTLTSGASNVLGIVGGAVGSLVVAFALSAPMLAGGGLVLIAAFFSLTAFKENYGDKKSDFSGLIRESLRHFKSKASLRNLTFGEMLRSTAFIVYFMVYQTYLVAIGMDKNLLGVYFSILMIATASGALLSSRVAGRVGRYRMLMAGSALLMTAYLLQLVVHDYVAAGALFAICGFTGGLAMPAVMVWRNEMIPSRIRASTLAVLSTFLNLAAAAMTMGFALTQLDPVAAMVVGAALAASSIPFYLLAHRKQEKGANELNGDALPADWPQPM